MELPLPRGHFWGIVDKGTSVNLYADPAGTFDVLVSVDGLASERSSRGRWAVRAGALVVLSHEPSGDPLLAPGTHVRHDGESLRFDLRSDPGPPLYVAPGAERDDGVRPIVLKRVE